jgi:hypothetical protein
MDFLYSLCSSLLPSLFIGSFHPEFVPGNPFMPGPYWHVPSALNPFHSASAHLILSLTQV